MIIRKDVDVVFQNMKREVRKHRQNFTIAGHFTGTFQTGIMGADKYTTLGVSVRISLKFLTVFLSPVMRKLATMLKRLKGDAICSLA